MILAASEILKIIIPMMNDFVLMIVLTKLWVQVQQGEDEGEYLIFLLPEESYEADNVVEQEWSQHRRNHSRMGDVETDLQIIVIIGAVARWILATLLIIIYQMRSRVTVLSSAVQFDDEIDVSDSVQGRQGDVQHQDDQDRLPLPHRHLLGCHFRCSNVRLTESCVNQRNLIFVKTRINDF